LSSRQPERTCLGCRKALPQSELLRLVRSPQGELLPDLHRRLPGRGVYLCYDRSCIALAFKKNLFQRGFGQPVAAIDGTEFESSLRALLEEQMRGLISLSRKAGKLLAGVPQLEERLGRENFALLVLAEDLSPARAAKLAAKASACKVSVIHYLSKESLGQLVGRDESGALGLRPGGLADSFKQALERYRQLSGEL